MELKMKLILKSVIILFMLTVAANAADCDGNLRASGPLGCYEDLNHQYTQKIVDLFYDGTLDPKKTAIRGTCVCIMQDDFVFCSADYEVHQCFQGASGTTWFSDTSTVESGTFSAWNRNSTIPNEDLISIKANVAERAANSLIKKLKVQ